MKILDIRPAWPQVISVIGAGGKSSFLEAVGTEFSGRKIISTTTKIAKSEHPTMDGGSLADIEGYFKDNPEGILVVASNYQEKLRAPKCSMEELAKYSDHLLVEADGSKRLPFKAHAAYEPLCVPNSMCVYIIGATAIDKPLQTHCHRAELVVERLGVNPNASLTPELIANYVSYEFEEKIIAPDLILINQRDAADPIRIAELIEQLQEKLPSIPVQAISLK